MDLNMSYSGDNVTCIRAAVTRLKTHLMVVSWRRLKVCAHHLDIWLASTSIQCAEGEAR